MLNYESELRERFEYELAEQYGVATDFVFGYFHLRYVIEHGNDSDVQLEQGLADFLIDELNLPKGEFFEYRGEKITRKFQYENSLINIMDNWLFSASIRSIKNSKGLMISYDEFIAKESKRLLRHGKNKAKAYKSSTHHNSYLKWNALKLLNKQYRAVPKNPRTMEGVCYPLEHNDFIRTLEELHFSNIHATELVSNEVASISESDLEKFLIKNLEALEEGLRFLEKQVSIQDGRIDILARDKSDNLVIIELKVQEDKELVWQSVYYPMQFKKERQLKKVRMVTVCPSYPPHILHTLRQIDGVEMIRFIPTVELGRVKHIETQKIS